jgi:hypothetical protein
VLNINLFEQAQIKWVLPLIGFGLTFHEKNIRAIMIVINKKREDYAFPSQI